MNIKEFAKLMNLAPSTISRALNNSYEISESTKQKVRAKAKELSFEPNPIASNLRKQKSKTIAVVVPDISNHFFAKVIEGVEKIAQKKDYHLLIYFTFDNTEKEIETINHLINGRVGGVVLSLSAQTNDYSHIKKLIERKIPLVFFDRTTTEIEAAQITINNKDAAFKATEHLIDNGCKKVLFLNFSEYALSSIQRKEGFTEACEKKTDLNKEINILSLTDSKQENFNLLVKKLETDRNIDGLLASSEGLTFLCYEVCNFLNLKIGKDIKVVGFTNSPLAEHLKPSLSCIYQPAHQIGNEVATVLFKSIEKVNVNYTDTRMSLPYQLLIRNSSK